LSDKRIDGKVHQTHCALPTLLGENMGCFLRPEHFSIWICELLRSDVPTLQVIRIQPNESIYLKINNKVPGLGLRLDTTKLDLSYSDRYRTQLPDAYERLILDVINGDKRLFIRNDELEVCVAFGLEQTRIQRKESHVLVSICVFVTAFLSNSSGSHKIRVGCLLCPMNE
jgi:hypothetical protein